MRQERKTWDVNDYAFILYADRKGLKLKQIAQALEVNASSLYQISMKMKAPATLSQKQQKRIHKGEVMAQEVLAGVYPNTRTLWDDKIEAVSGLHFTYPETKREDKGEEAPIVEKPIVSEKATLFEFRVNIGTLKSIISAFRN